MPEQQRRQQQGQDHVEHAATDVNIAQPSFQINSDQDRQRDVEHVELNPPLLQPAQLGRQSRRRRGTPARNTYSRNTSGVCVCKRRMRRETALAARCNLVRGRRNMRNSSQRADWRTTKPCTASAASERHSRSPRSTACSTAPAGQQPSPDATPADATIASRRPEAAAQTPASGERPRLPTACRRQPCSRAARSRPPPAEDTRATAARPAPISTQHAARTTIGHRIAAPASWRVRPPRCAARRGTRMPKALVKQAAASPPISASPPIDQHAQQRPTPVADARSRHRRQARPGRSATR